jgi:hypothetical protein
VLFPGDVERQWRPFMVAADRGASALSDLDRTGANTERPQMGQPGSCPQRPGLSFGLFHIFLRKCSVILICLQSLKMHKYFSVHANGVIQISLDSLIDYLLGGIGLTSVGAL